MRAFNNNFNMFKAINISKSLQLFIAIIIAILTTGFLRLQLFSGVPEPDGGYYTFHSQYIHYALTHGQDLKDMGLFLYQFMTAWVYGFDLNQYISLRLIDGLIAITASIILFKVILKESGSPLFTFILVTTLLILMNDIENIAYGFRNSTWAAYLPLFSALLIWQNISKEDKYSFYLIGGLVSLGILLREPFLPFFLLAAIAIFIGYGRRVLIKYLIGSAVVGFSVLGVMLMFRGWDLLGLINSYLIRNAGVVVYNNLIPGYFFHFGLSSIKANWFIYAAGSVSVIYLFKLYSTNKNLVNTNRVYFWLAIFLLPMLEPIMKIGFEYHFANTLPGLAGLSAMGWKHLMTQESKKVTTSSILIIGLLSLIVILPTINRTLIKSSNIYGPIDAIKWAKASDSFRGDQMIERSQYLKVAAKVYGLSREDSTLAVRGKMAAIFPLTGLLPPTFELHDLKTLYTRLNFDDEELIKIIQKYRPTLVITTHLSSSPLDKDEIYFPEIIENTNLYEKVGIIEENLAINYGFKAGTIYRLKDFK